MGIWAGIKHALNSTLGTKVFQPLDKLIINQTRMVTSEDIYCTFEDASVSVTNTQQNVLEDAFLKYPIKIKMTRPGFATLFANLKRTSDNNDFNYANTRFVAGEFRVYKNDALIGKWEKGFSAEGIAEGIEDFMLDISFEYGDVFSFELYVKENHPTIPGKGTGTVSLTNFSLLGKVVHNVFDTITE